ncbi:MAG: hypothetical protein ACE361_21220 [Aureliella sp.]
MKKLAVIALMLGAVGLLGASVSGLAVGQVASGTGVQAGFLTEPNASTAGEESVQEGEILEDWEFTLRRRRPKCGFNR